VFTTSLLLDLIYTIRTVEKFPIEFFPSDRRGAYNINDSNALPGETNELWTNWGAGGLRSGLETSKP